MQEQHHQLKYNKISSNQNFMYFIGQRERDFEKGDSIIDINKANILPENRLYEWSKSFPMPKLKVLKYNEREYTPLSVTCGASYTAVLGKLIPALSPDHQPAVKQQFKHMEMIE